MNLKQLFFFDCEYVPIVKQFSDLKTEFPELYDSWHRRCKKWNDDRNILEEEPLSDETFWKREAHKMSEFLKTICISFGYLGKDGQFKIGSFYDNNEVEILKLFNQLLDNVSKKGMVLSGYSIKRYDMPFLAKRMTINNIKPSEMLNVYGKKPWDVNVYDLIEVWGQGCHGESYTPFDICLTVNKVVTSKDDISGYEVKKVYYNEGRSGLERIKDYCEKDVKASYDLALKFNSL